MSQIPESLMNSLTDLKGFDRAAFESVHAIRESITSIRLNEKKWSRYFAEDAAFADLLSIAGKVPWCSTGFYLSQRPAFTFDPLFHAGLYYVQEASSMFLEQAIKQTVDLSADLKVLDLCAAPGGKSTLIQSLLTPNSLLVTNEVIKSRAAILEENITKWGSANTIVTNNDPKDFARLDHFFDLIVVDAPCSGSGLFRRDPDAISEWSEQQVEICSQRQQRILLDCWDALKEDGVLIYSTCSFSKQEDEDILSWMMEHLQCAGIQLSINPNWKIVETSVANGSAYGYRFWPDQVKGEGFFICCVRKQSGQSSSRRPVKQRKFEHASRAEEQVIQPWLKEGQTILKQADQFFYWPSNLETDLQWIAAQSMYIKQVGTRIGKLAGKDLIPDHALALSANLSEELVAISLKYEEAIQYLRKEEVQISQPDHTQKRGWALACYRELPLGWVKILPNRINNYYPKEWRILKK